MSDWQDKSDYEINVAVYNKKYGEPKSEFAHFFSALPIPNYCNNPSDAWPIILENKIDLSFAVESLGDIGQAKVYIEGDTDIFSEFTDNNKALRSAMIVYLEMNGVKP